MTADSKYQPTYIPVAYSYGEINMKGVESVPPKTKDNRAVSLPKLDLTFKGVDKSK